MPETYRSIVESFREKVLSRDAEAVILLLREYGAAILRIQKRLDDLLKIIDRLRRQGRVVSETDLLRELRYRQFLFQLRDEMTDYASLVASVVSEAQKEVIQLSFDQVDSLLKYTYSDLPQGIFESFTRFDEFSARNIVAKVNDEIYLKSITGKFEPIALSVAREILTDGVITGRSVSDIKRDFVRKLEIVPVRAETIARTEVISAYREGNLERYKLSRTVKAWEWSATLDERTCPICIALDGQQFSLDTPFATHPNCRCSPLPITFTFEELGLGYLNLKEPRPVSFGLRGEDWFRSRSDSVKRKILGKSKFELYRAGEIKLQDLVQDFVHPVYGPSRQERSLKSMRDLRIIR